MTPRLGHSQNYVQVFKHSTVYATLERLIKYLYRVTASVVLEVDVHKIRMPKLRAIYCSLFLATFFRFPCIESTDQNVVVVIISIYFSFSVIFDDHFPSLYYSSGSMQVSPFCKMYLDNVAQPLL